MSGIFNIEDGILCQQVNCRNAIGGGLSGAIIKTFPVVEEKYHLLFDHYKGEELFGKKQMVKVSDTLSVCNIFSQFDYGNPQRTGKVYTNSEYLLAAIKEIAEKNSDKKVYIPFNIGCGLGGEKWDKVFNEIKALNLPNLYLIDCLHSVNMPFAQATANTFVEKDPNMDLKEDNSKDLKINPVFKNKKLSEKDYNILKSNCLRFLSTDMQYKTTEINEDLQIVSITGLTYNGDGNSNHIKREYSYKEIKDKFEKMVIPDNEKYEVNEKIEGIMALKDVINDRNIMICNLNLIREMMKNCDIKHIILFDKLNLHLLKEDKGIIISSVKGDKSIRYTEPICDNLYGAWYAERSLAKDFNDLIALIDKSSPSEFTLAILNELEVKYKEIQKIKGIDSEVFEKEEEMTERA